MATKKIKTKTCQFQKLKTREDSDDSENPKIVKKGDKPKVQDLIQDQCDDLAISKAQEDIKVSVTSFKLELRVPHVLV
jgi:hypothetical protein